MRRVLVCTALGLLPGGLSASPVSPHAHQAVEIIQQLRDIGLPRSDDFQAGPPAKVPGLLRLLNQELKALIVEDLNDQNRHAVPSENEILEQLTAAGWEEIPNHKWNAYGEIREIKFDWMTGYDPGILIVSTQLWLPCGGADPDSAIYIFQGLARHWDLILATESDFDPAGENDETGLQYQISPPDSRGRWFLLVAHVAPFCRRNTSVLRYKALRPGAAPEKPIVLLAGQATVNSFFDPPFRIDVDTDRFTLTHGITRKLDGEPGVAIFHFDLSKGQRTFPLALTPEDFLDQWTQMSWEDARRWTKSPSDSSLLQWHLQLSGLASDSTEIESVRRCPHPHADDQRWLVELSIDQRLNPTIGVEQLYIEVLSSAGTFYLAGIRTSDLPACHGKTPPTSYVEHVLPHWW